MVNPSRQHVSSGSPYESRLGFARAVRIGPLISNGADSPLAPALAPAFSANGSSLGVHESGPEEENWPAGVHDESPIGEPFALFPVGLATWNGFPTLNFSIGRGDQNTGDSRLFMHI